MPAKKTSTEPEVKPVATKTMARRARRHQDRWRPPSPAANP